MARHRRLVSETGIYHVMSRGVGQKSIFIDREDNEKYLSILNEKRKIANFILYGYCIMGNHSHLIIKEEGLPLPSIMKRINVSYASYFNKKYGRVGHVFQGRYRSEPIEDDEYLLTALRYIHNNPVKARIVNNCGDFHWSSYNYYIDKTSDNFIETDFILPLFANQVDESIRLFIEFSNDPNNDKFIDISKDYEKLEIRGRLEARKYVERYLGREGLELRDLKESEKRNKRNELILYLRKNSDLSIRDIASLLKLGRGTVGNVKI